MLIFEAALPRLSGAEPPADAEQAPSSLAVGQSGGAAGLPLRFLPRSPMVWPFTSVY